MMPQIFNDYQDLAMRTCKDMGNRKLNIAHMVIGLTSELHELYSAIDKQDLVNISEEIADKYWYLAGLCTLYNISLVDIISDRDENTGLDLADEISKLNEIIKKDIIYDKYPIQLGKLAGVSQLLKELVANNILNVVNCLASIEAESNINLEKALIANIEKLKVRYPDKYTDEKAINRDLKSEREMLEG